MPKILYIGYFPYFFSFFYSLSSFISYCCSYVVESLNDFADCTSDLISLVSRNVYRADVIPKIVKRKMIYYGYFYEQLRFVSLWFGVSFIFYLL